MKIKIPEYLEVTSSSPLQVDYSNGIPVLSPTTEFVTAHSAGSLTSGDQQKIYGIKEFKDEIGLSDVTCSGNVEINGTLQVDGEVSFSYLDFVSITGENIECDNLFAESSESFYLNVGPTESNYSPIDGIISLYQGTVGENACAEIRFYGSQGNPGLQGNLGNWRIQGHCDIDDFSFNELWIKLYNNNTPITGDGIKIDANYTLTVPSISTGSISPNCIVNLIVGNGRGSLAEITITNITDNTVITVNRGDTVYNGATFSGKEVNITLDDSSVSGKWRILNKANVTHSGTKCLAIRSE